MYTANKSHIELALNKIKGSESENKREIRKANSVLRSTSTQNKMKPL